MYTQRTVMSTSTRLIPLLALALLCVGCATTDVGHHRGAPVGGLYGIAGDRLFAVRGGGSFATSPDLGDVGALAWAPKAGRFYAIADATSKPRLITVDPTTGEATAIGPIATPSLELTLAEGLAVDPRDGTLYAAAGESTFASNVLLNVDPATGEAQLIAQIRGTIQDEIDAMAFAGDALYAVDGAGGSSALYRIDSETGQASRASDPFAVTVTDLAFDPAGGRLVGTRGNDGQLFAISLDGTVSEIATEARALEAIAIIPTDSSNQLFGDGFESGDASTWSRRAEQEPR